VYQLYIIPTYLPLFLNIFIVSDEGRYPRVLSAVFNCEIIVRTMVLYIIFYIYKVARTLCDSVCVCLCCNILPIEVILYIIFGEAYYT